MWNDIDRDTTFLNSDTTVGSLLNTIGSKLQTIESIEAYDLTLEYNPEHGYGITYFNVDNREYSFDDGVTALKLAEEILAPFNATDLEWELNDAYPDGYASYVLYFKLL